MTGMITALGWEKYRNPDNPRQIVLPPTTLGSMAKENPGSPQDPQHAGDRRSFLDGQQSRVQSRLRELDGIAAVAREP